jgi:anti-repressor protein
MELIKVTENNGKTAVSARELHAFLEVETPLTKWALRMFEYGFEENVDWTKLSTENQQVDYAITLDCAKHLAMMQRTEKGMAARNYFIECEKQIKSALPQTYKEALLALIAKEEEKEQLALQVDNLSTALDVLIEWVSIIKVAKHNKVSEKLFDWRLLKQSSNDMGFSIKKAESPRYGYQNCTM